MESEETRFFLFYWLTGTDLHLLSPTSLGAGRGVGGPPPKAQKIHHIINMISVSAALPDARGGLPRLSPPPLDQSLG